MVCPKCGSDDYKVTNSRQQGCKSMGENIIYRMRKCNSCGNKWQTVEVVWNSGKPPSKIIKLASGEDERFEYELWARRKE